MPRPDVGLSEQILATAKSLFINKGYYGLSMREISEALGVSKAALYYHFKDKEQLFLAILNVYLDDMEVTLDRIIAESSSSKDQIRLFVEYVLTQPAEQRATIRLASQEIVHVDQPSRKAFEKIYREKFVGKIQSILNTGMNNGEFRNIQPEVAVWALLGIMYPYFSAHTGNSPVSANTIREILAIYFAGIEK